MFYLESNYVAIRLEVFNKRIFVRIDFCQTFGVEENKLKVVFVSLKVFKRLIVYFIEFNTLMD